MKLNFLYKNSFCHSFNDSLAGGDLTSDENLSMDSFSSSMREKRARAGRAGGIKTAALYNMRNIGSLGGKASQSRGTAHKLTREERSRGGTQSKRS